MIALSSEYIGAIGVMHLWWGFFLLFSCFFFVRGIMVVSDGNQQVWFWWTSSEKHRARKELGPGDPWQLTNFWPPLVKSMQRPTQPSTLTQRLPRPSVQPRQRASSQRNIKLTRSDQIQRDANNIRVFVSGAGDFARWCSDGLTKKIKENCLQ